MSLLGRYKCYDCGEVFDGEDADTVSECVGEFWGTPAYMDYVACPFCRSTDVTEYTESDEEEDGE